MSRGRARTCPPGAIAALFVEGGDEDSMVQALLGTRTAFVRPIRGSNTQRVSEAVRATTKDPGWPNISRVGVILDAGDDPAAARALCEQLLTEAGFPIPSAVEAVEQDGARASGIYLLPGGGALGGSDTLLLRTARPAERTCVEAFFACIGEPPGTLEQRDKARATAWAASKKQRPYELWRTVDPTHAELAPLKAFLDALVP